MGLELFLQGLLNHDIKVIVDLHAAPGSQNGFHHSGTRDGFLEWGESKIPETVAVIDFLAHRYAHSPSLVAIELLNEPLAPNVTFGYDVVRKYTSTAYVILSSRFGPASNSEFLPLASGLGPLVIDVHYYSLYKSFEKLNCTTEHCSHIYNKRASQLQEVTPSNGPLSFV
ncbi:hypothetical protein RJ639_011972, partial [Escallonia herrerae]